MTTTPNPADEKVPWLPTALEVARNALRCLYIAVDPSIARDVSDKCEVAFHALQKDSFRRENIPTELVAKSAPQEAQVAVGDDLIKLLRDAQDCVWAHWKGERFPRDWEIHEALRLTADRLTATPPREVAAVEPADPSTSTGRAEFEAWMKFHRPSIPLAKFAIQHHQDDIRLYGTYEDREAQAHWLIFLHGAKTATDTQSPARQGGAVAYIDGKAACEQTVVWLEDVPSFGSRVYLYTHAESPSLPVSVVREAIDDCVPVAEAWRIKYRLAATLPASDRHLLLGGKS